MLFPFLFFFLFSLIALVIATRSDLRERIVSNKLNYAMVAVGLAGHAVWAALAGEAGILANCVGAVIGMFAFAFVLYKAGVWAGGDVKLFAGLAALNPVNPAVLWRSGLHSIPALGAIELPLFPFTLFIFSLLAMLPYGVFLAMRRLGRNREQGKRVLGQFRLFGAGFAVVAVLAVAAGWYGWGELAQVLAMLLALWAVFFLLRLYRMSKVLMRKAVKVTDLEEGMIVAETIVETRQGVERKPEVGIRTLINQFAANRLEKALKQGREIASSRHAGGVTKEEISELKRLVRAGKLEDAIMVKESAPMVPAVLIAYVVLNLVGDFVWLGL